MPFEGFFFPAIQLVIGQMNNNFAQIFLLSKHMGIALCRVHSNVVESYGQGQRS